MPAKRERGKQGASSRRGQRARGVSIVLAVLALVAVLASAAIASDKKNLSETSGRTSAYPDLAVNSDGSTVAVVWIEAGNVYARVRSDGSWGDREAIFAAEEEAVDAAVGVTEDGEIHLTYALKSPVKVLYTEYGSLDRELVEELNTDEKITWVDLAMDADGGIHLVWAKYNQSGQDGEIYYSSKPAGGNWGSSDRIAGEGDNRAPAIVAADGYVHVAWRDDVAGSISYRRKAVNAETWESTIGLGAQGNPVTPDVAARSNRVFVVWDECSDTECSLAYQFSANSGSSWAEGSEAIGTTYDSTLGSLRPSVALSSQGYPAAVYHADRGDYPAIHYSVAVTTTVGEWITPTTLSQVSGESLRDAVVGIGGNHLHIAYRQSVGDYWDVYYENFSYSPDATITADPRGFVLLGETVTLDGSGSSELPGLPSSYDWQLTDKPTGSGATLSTSSGASTELEVDVKGRYTVTLVIDNGFGTDSAITVIQATDEIYSVYLPLVAKGYGAGDE